MNKQRLFLLGAALLSAGIVSYTLITGMGMRRHHQGMMGGGMMGGAPSRNDTAPLNEEARRAPGAKAFLQVCSRCHAPPAPSRHTPQEWPAVVARMKQHMITFGKPVPPVDTLQAITEFLQARSK